MVMRLGRTAIFSRVVGEHHNWTARHSDCLVCYPFGICLSDEAIPSNAACCKALLTILR